MADFKVVEAGMYDDLVKDADGRVVNRVPLSIPFRLGQTKKILFIFSGDAGTYIAAVEIKRPNGNHEVRPLGEITLREGEFFECTLEELINVLPDPGWYSVTLFVGGVAIGGYKIQF